jgi:hypothetical protein
MEYTIRNSRQLSSLDNNITKLTIDCDLHDYDLNIRTEELDEDSEEESETTLEEPRPFKFPPNLEKLTIKNTQLYHFPDFPPKLVYLNIINNKNLLTISNLPHTLQFFKCEDNKEIDELPHLPESLIQLSCINNKLYEIPNIPNNLIYLNLAKNDINKLPNLVNSHLTYFNCEMNNLSTISDLPPTLIELIVGSNYKLKLPNLNTLNELKIFDCKNIELYELPDLPESLTELNCALNELEELPNLKYLNNLKKLIVNDNYYLSKLPELPESLIYLNCSQTVASRDLPTFHENLVTVISNAPQEEVEYVENEEDVALRVQREREENEDEEGRLQREENEDEEDVALRLQREEERENEKLAFHVHNAFASLNFSEIVNIIKNLVPNLPSTNPHDFKIIFTNILKEGISHFAKTEQKIWTDKLNFINTERLDGFNMQYGLNEYGALFIEACCCVLRYVSTLDNSFKRMYVTMLLTDITEAYKYKNPSDRLSCVKGIFERIITTFISTIKYFSNVTTVTKKHPKHVSKKTRKKNNNTKKVFTQLLDIKEKNLPNDVLEWVKAHKGGKDLPPETDIEGRKENLKAFLMLRQHNEGQIDAFIDDVNNVEFDDGYFTYGGKGKRKRKIKTTKKRKTKKTRKIKRKIK